MKVDYIKYAALDKTTEDLLIQKVKEAIRLLWDDTIRSTLRATYRSCPVFGTDLRMYFEFMIPGQIIALLLGLPPEDGRLEFFPDDWF